MEIRTCVGKSCLIYLRYYERVVDEVFTDLSPAGPEMSGEKKSTDDTKNKRSPYTITVSHFAIVKEMELSTVSKSPNKGQTGWLVPWLRGYSLHYLYRYMHDTKECFFFQAFWP